MPVSKGKREGGGEGGAEGLTFVWMSLQFFYRKLYRLVHTRLRALCDCLHIEGELMQRVRGCAASDAAATACPHGRGHCVYVRMHDA
jgi:hypothetical protein